MENQDANGNSNDGRIYRLSDGAIVNTDDKIVGTWKLVSASSTTSKGEFCEPPYGLSPLGFLTYTADGRVTALISYSGRKPLFGGGGARAQE
jgi:hypothetical protein